MAFGHFVLCFIWRAKAISPTCGGDGAWGQWVPAVSPGDGTGWGWDCVGVYELEPQGSESLVGNRYHRAEYHDGTYWYFIFTSRVKPRWKGRIMAGKYTPLEDYLRGLPVNQREVVLSFEQIERIINAKLPPSAYGYQQWWENEKEGNHVNARAWANAGWKVEGVDFSEKWVQLVRK